MSDDVTRIHIRTGYRPSGGMTDDWQMPFENWPLLLHKSAPVAERLVPLPARLLLPSAKVTRNGWRMAPFHWLRRVLRLV